MTTIAWDGTTLAADNCSWSGGARRKVRKVGKCVINGEECLVAGAGPQSFVLAVLEWFKGKGEKPNPIEHGANADSYCLVIITRDLKVKIVSNSLVIAPFNEKIFAGGAGQEFAWGALEAGATAKQAVLIAAKRSDYAGLGVSCVSFGNSRK